MSGAEAIRFEREPGGVATIWFDLPDKAVNVLNEATVRGFADAVERVISDSSVIGAVLASPKNDFVVGLDLNEVGTGGIDRLPDAIEAFHALTRRMELGGKPFVAALGGSALGGGCEIALACHRRFGASESNGRFGCPEVTVGLIPAGGGTQRMPRLAGIVTALPLMLEGRRMKFADAAKAKLIDELVPGADLLDSARRWVRANPHARQPWDEKSFKFPGGTPLDPRVAEAFVGAGAMLRKKTWGNFPATRAILSAVYEGSLVDIDSGLRVEAAYFRKIIAGPEARAMVKTLFFSLNEANKLRARPPHVPKHSFAHVGVLGAGMMGAGIANVTAKAGARVTLIDRDLASAERGASKAAGDDETLRSRISAAESYDGLSDADLVIEAVFEDRAIKADVTKRVESVAPARLVFGSNTSTLPISSLAEASSRPERFIGIHFFSPVERMPLVEIIRGEKTGDEALAAALDYVRFIGKTPIVVRDSRGFFTSRVFSTYVMEGLAMLREGVPAALIENAGRMAGMAVGPLAVADEVSFSLLAHVIGQTKADLGSAYVAGPADDVVALFVDTLGRRGKAAGAGVYEYPQGGKKFLWPELRSVFAPASDVPDAKLVEERLLYVQTAEALRCKAEGVLDDPAMGDVGSILGWGFPAFTGGVFSYIDYVGASRFEARAAELAAQYGPRFAVVRGALQGAGA